MLGWLLWGWGKGKWGICRGWDWGSLWPISGVKGSRTSNRKSQNKRGKVIVNRITVINRRTTNSKT